MADINLNAWDLQWLALGGTLLFGEGSTIAVDSTVSKGTFARAAKGLRDTDPLTISNEKGLNNTFVAFADVNATPTSDELARNAIENKVAAMAIRLDEDLGIAAFIRGGGTGAPP